MSKKKIIEELTAKGIYNRDGKPFGNTALQSALKSEKYLGILRWNDIVIEGGCPALIDKATFDKVQERIAQNKRAGGTKKARMEYLLTGKLFCGHCGAHMIGESGRGRSGDMFYYYSCYNRKRNRTCEKKNEKKDYLEWYVVEQTIEYVLTPARLEFIAERVIAAYNDEFGNKRIRELERRLAKIERDAKKCIDDYIATDSKLIKKGLEEKADLLEAQKADLEIDLAKLRVANNIQYTKEAIMAWLKQFCVGDLFDMEFRKRIIDVFINSIYLYDDKVIIYYNVKEAKQVSYIEMLDSTEEPGADADSLEGSAVRIPNDVLHQMKQIRTRS